MNIFFFALVCAGLFGFTFIYHHKKNKKPYYTYGNKKIQFWTINLIAIGVFIGIDATISTVANKDLRDVFWNWPKDKEQPVKIQVMGQQWVWKFRYAGGDGVFNTQDDVVTVNDLRLPINKKVLFQLTSKDVIHSFFLPNTRRKVDAMPGRISRMWFELTKTGEYPIVCAEMCGTAHYKMGAKLTTYSPEDYESWLGQAQKLALQTNDPEDLDLYWGWKWE
jgi:cytochrome c oxidase subunit 2